jgi:hypothetical protein
MGLSIPVPAMLRRAAGQMQPRRPAFGGSYTETLSASASDKRCALIQNDVESPFGGSYTETLSASASDKRCALIQNDVESPFGGRTGHGRATSEARRIVHARAANMHPVALLLRAAQGLRIPAVCDALAVDPASCFRVGHQQGLDPLPAR